MDALQEARDFFGKDRYAAAAGIELMEIGPGYAKCRMPLGPGHRNALGQVMGGAIYTLADFVFAAATNFRQPPTVTTTCQISYLSAVKGTELWGESKLLRDGRRSCFYQITITDELGTPVAVTSLCGTHLDPRPGDKG